MFSECPGVSVRFPCAAATSENEIAASAGPRDGDIQIKRTDGLGAEDTGGVSLRQASRIDGPRTWSEIRDYADRLAARSRAFRCAMACAALLALEPDDFAALMASRAEVRR